MEFQIPSGSLISGSQEISTPGPVFGAEPIKASILNVKEELKTCSKWILSAYMQCVKESFEEMRIPPSELEQSTIMTFQARSKVNQLRVYKGISSSLYQDSGFLSGKQVIVGARRGDFHEVPMFHFQDWKADTKVGASN